MKIPCFVLAVGLSLLAGFARAHVPVPDSVLHPTTASEAWNVLRLASANLDRLIQENRLTEIPDQASLCSPALRALPPALPSPDARHAVAAGAVRASVTLTTLAQAAVAGDRDLATRSLDAFHANLHDLAASFDPATVAADIFACPMHPDVVGPDPAAPCPKCGMRPVVRRIPYSFVFTPPGEPTLHLAATSDPTPLVPGHATPVNVRLTHGDGSPVLLPELEVVHTQPIHLLIIDPSLGDYHHEHPLPTSVPGEYTFSFTPAKPTRYRIYADLVPAATGVQEYPFTDLPGGGDVPPAIDKTEITSTQVGGLFFRLDWSALPRANQVQTLHVTVTDAAGQPVTSLEPVMAAFAHLVGFYDDGRTVVHLHPAGAEATDPSLRGGPTLDFRFFPPRAGFLRLYCQVQVNGQPLFASFGTTVAP